MNVNFLTNTKDFDYRFVVRLAKSIFDKEELANGCVTSNNQRPSRYQKLDTLKFDFVKGMDILSFSIVYVTRNKNDLYYVLFLHLQHYFANEWELTNKDFQTFIVMSTHIVHI